MMRRIRRRERERGGRCIWLGMREEGLSAVTVFF
jgi:hypothetical protein